MTQWMAIVPILVGGGQARTPMFTPAERDQVVQFWHQPGRYEVVPPERMRTDGLYQVRLTVEGSTWFLNYNRARGLRVPPTQTAGAQNAEEKIWEDWLDRKVAWDRFHAAQRAEEANEKIVGRRIRELDPAIPLADPGWPGPAPEAMVALAGNPPVFAESVVPMEHRITFADGLTLRYEDNVKMRPRYAYYRFSKGSISVGTPVKSLPSRDLDRLFRLAGASPAESKVMRAVSLLEGGFDSVNTYDTGYISVGFIQFASLQGGSNSLGQMLLDYKQNHALDFQRDFRQYGIDVTPAGVLAVLDLDTGVEIDGAIATQEVIMDKRFLAVFQRAGRVSETFNASQIRAAKRMFYPGDDPVTVTLNNRMVTGKVTDVIKSEAGLATLMDRKVNTGKIDLLGSVLQQVADKYRLKNLSDLARREREIVIALKYRKDYLTDKELSQPR